MNFKIYVHCDDDIRLCRRSYLKIKIINNYLCYFYQVKRDMEERGREVNGILYQYNRFVKPSFDEFVKPVRN